MMNYLNNPMYPFMKSSLQRSFRHFLVIASFIFPGIPSQSQVIDSLQKQFIDFTIKRPEEKLYLQTDKSVYLAGEIIWFNIFQVDGISNKPVDLSKLAYVELLDHENKSVAEAKIELKNAGGNGSFFIPSQIVSGNYRIRAYTNWMKNFGASFFFEKPLQVINTLKTPAILNPEKAVNFDIRFFPEGGNLVKGLKSKIAFRVTDQYGKGQVFNGALINSKNDTVARFQPSQFGIGTFSFLPEEKENYRSVIWVNGKSIIQPFITALENGYAMSLQQTQPGELTIEVNSNIPSAATVYLLVHSRQSLKYIMAVPLSGGSGSLQLSTQKLAAGITHFTVFNSNRQPVCERLYFKMPASHLDIKLNLPTTALSTRNKLMLGINSYVDGQPASAAMAMSVYRIDSLQSIPDQDIQSYLLLSADLSGKVESPSWYFHLPPTEGALAIDQLMLTHGWRKFNWQQVTERKADYFEFPPEFNGHLVTAKLTDSKSGTVAAGATGYMSLPGSPNIFSTATSDQQGILRFEMKSRYGPSEMILQASQNQDSSIQAELVNPFSVQYSTTPLPAFSLPAGLPNTLTEHHINVQVRNIFTGQQLRHFINPAEDSSNFYAGARFTYMLDDYTRFKTMEEVLREYVKLIFLKKRGGSYYLQVYDEEAKKTLDNDALVLIDGVPVFDFNKFMTIDPLRIRKLEVINNRYIFGNSIFDGILHWTSYQHDLAGYELDPRAVVVNYEGLQLKREFYTPVYDVENAAVSHTPDFRNLLLWSPGIRTSEKETTMLPCYTSDLPGRYAVIAEGITKDGVCGSVIGYFEVK